jgi:hypothetical protein
MIVAAVGYGSDRPPEEGGLNMRSRDLSPFATEFSPEPRGEPFRIFMQEELIPFIESAYRVDPDLRALYGFSLGGLFGLYVMFRSPDLFRRHIIVSPALMPSTFHIIEQAEAFSASEPQQPLALYMCVGELELFVPLFDRLVAVLGRKTGPRLRFESEVLQRGIHATAPAEALAKGLRMVFGRRSIYEAMYQAYMKGGIASAKALYNDLEARADPNYRYGEEELNSFGYMLLYRDEVHEAIEVFQLNVLAYPEAWNVYDSLGEAYMACGETALAKSNYERSIQLNPQNEAGIVQLRKLESAPEAPTAGTH